jgi:phage terminase small subunit
MSEKQSKPKKRKALVGPDGLTPKQRRFCIEYVKDMNATRAYVDAYGHDNRASARVFGCRLLTKDHIQHRINLEFQEMAKEGRVKAQMVIRELALIAFSEVSAAVEWSDAGMTIRDSKDMTRDERAVIQEISVTPVVNLSGHVADTKKVKMHNKAKALETLAKYFGLLDNGSGDDSDKKPFKLNYEPEQLKAFVKDKDEP